MENRPFFGRSDKRQTHLQEEMQTGQPQNGSRVLFLRAERTRSELQCYRCPCPRAHMALQPKCCEWLIQRFFPSPLSSRRIGKIRPQVMSLPWPSRAELFLAACPDVHGFPSHVPLKGASNSGRQLNKINIYIYMQKKKKRPPGN